MFCIVHPNDPHLFLQSSFTFCLLALVGMSGYINKVQPMKERMHATANRIQHITHMLNTSTAKLAHPFRWAQRFPPNKSLSPDAHYDLPSSLGKRSCSFGIGIRRSLQKIDHTEPARYNIPSQFDIKKQKGIKGAFGIGRDEYYKGKTHKIPLGPGQYTIKDPIGSKKFYMGQKISPAQRNQTGNRSFRKEEGYSSQSHRNKDIQLRMKTEYASKQPFNSGSYTQRSAFTQNSGSYSQQRKKTNSFGDIGRGKPPKSSQPGPGSYKMFSEFGNNL